MDRITKSYLENFSNLFSLDTKMDQSIKLENFIKSNKKIYGEVIFTQAKTSAYFDSKEVSNFGLSVNDFISESPKYTWNDNAREKIKLFNKLISYVSDFEEKPVGHLYYVCLGTDGKD